MRIRWAMQSVFFGVMYLLSLPLYGQEPTKRAAVPGDDALAPALKLVKEVYGDEYASAKTAEQKKALAHKLLQKARESEKDFPAQFALLRLSRDIATQAADGLAAFHAIDEMGRSFDIDALEMKADVLAAFTKKARLAVDHKSIAAQALPLLDQAIAKDDFDLAARLGILILSQARVANDSQLLRHVQQQVKEAETIAQSYVDVKAATATLEKSPTDPRANLIVGRYLCFTKGDWEKGVAMLALGDDETLKSLAAKDLRGAESPSEQAQLGDAWWDLADKEDARAQRRGRLHAASWYRQSLPGLSGLTKARVEKRLDSLDSTSAAHLLAPAPKAPPSSDITATMSGGVRLRNGILLRNQHLTSQQSYATPVEIEYVCGTDSTNIRVAYACKQLIFNWELNLSELRIDGGPVSGQHRPGAGRVPVNKLVTIRQVVNADKMEVFVDGQLRASWKGDFSQVNEPIALFSSHGSTVTVKSVRVKKL